MPRDDHDAPTRFARLTTETTPLPPPPMPTAAPPPPPPPPASDPPVVAAGQVSAQSVEAKPAGPPKGWQIDADQLSAFTHAVEVVRDRLSDVQRKVDRMQDASYMPKLGTSPAGVQLEEKFTDRLDAALDDPTNPTTGGLRPMLKEAMRRMDEFVATAETAVRSYQAHDDAAAVHLTTTSTKPAG